MRFFFVSLSARFKGAEMLGSFCLPFGKEKCSPQIPAALLVSEICPELQPHIAKGRQGNSSHLDRIQAHSHLQAKNILSHKWGGEGFKSRFWFHLGQYLWIRFDSNEVVNISPRFRSASPKSSVCSSDEGTWRDASALLVPPRQKLGQSGLAAADLV